MNTVNNGYVYKICNPAGKIYIGSTRKVRQRKLQYTSLACKGQSKLYKSLAKYGVENHLFQIIWEGDVSEMYKKEREFGIKFHALSREIGLNTMLPADRDHPQTINQEFGQKISDATKGKRVGEDNHFYGKKHSEETKRKLSAHQKGRYTGVNNPNYGRRWSAEKKQEHSQKLKDRTWKPSEEFKKKHSERMKIFSNEVGGVAIPKRVFQYDLEGNFINSFSSRVEAHRKTGVTLSSISGVITGKYTQANGYIFSYILLD